MVKISITRGFEFGKKCLANAFGYGSEKTLTSTAKTSFKPIYSRGLTKTGEKIKMFNGAEISPARTVNKSKNLFCEETWATCVSERANQNSVSLHGQLNGINHHLAKGSPNPKHMDEKFFATGQTPREMICDTDWEFKFKVKPIKEEMNVTRCASKREDWDGYYPRYKQTLNLKAGEKTYMPEYAYASSDFGYASTYLGDTDGIVMNIEIPKNARISRTGDIGKCDEIVFPRFSMFECTSAPKKVIDGDKSYYRVGLRYILPSEKWRELPEKI